MKRVLVACICCMIGVSCITSCGSTTKESNTNTPVVEEDVKEFTETFEAGVYTTEDYKVSIDDYGLAEDNKFVIKYTFENNSDEEMSPDQVWGYTLKVTQADDPVELSRLSTDLAEAYSSETDVLHESVKSGDSVSGMLVYEIPDVKTGINITVKALNTKDNKSLGEFTLEMNKIELELPESEKEEVKAPVETEVPDNERTGADDALDHTQKELEESK